MRIFILHIFILISFPSFSQKEECKIIVFENIGKCIKGAGGDLIITEIPIPKPYRDIVKDPSYSTEPEYGVQLEDSDNTIMYECTDSLDLDFLSNIISHSISKFNFVKSGLLADNSSAKGSIQIRLYNAAGIRLDCYYCIGLNNAQKWVEFVIAESNKNHQYVMWEFASTLSYFISQIESDC